MLKKNGVIPHIKITGADSSQPDRATHSPEAKERATPTSVPNVKGSRSYTKAVEAGHIDPSTSSLDRALVEDIEKNVEKFRSPQADDSMDSSTSGSKGEDKMLSPTATSSSAAKILSEHERKIGHRRVDEEGKVTYKRVTSSQLLKSIQLGLNHAIGGLSSKPQRDVLMQDFTMIEVVTFPREGSSTTAAHDFSDFRFKTYAPVAFRYFRELFGIKTDDFLVSLCGQPPRELSNPGASGSVFFVTCDDEFILKTLQRKEASFLEKLLPGYYMNLNQNPRTLLPKFFGLYCYQSGGKNIRLIVMNNLIPSSLKIHEKYDLKGSTYKRKASKYERLKATPTYKDLDFLEFHPEGLMLEPDTYDALIKTLKRDCLVLESFKIMDYSFLMGVHNLDLTLREKKLHLKEKEAKQMATEQNNMTTHQGYEDGIKESNESFIVDSADRDNDFKAFHPNDHSEKKTFNRNRSIKRVTAYSTAMESIQAESEPIDLEEQDAPPGGIPARNAQGERLLCFIGIIDILQCYELKKKLEHTFKSIFHDGDTVSVHRPSFYAQRFKDFICNRVFRKVPSPTLRSNPLHQGVASTSSANNIPTHFPLYPHKMVPAIGPLPLEPLLEEEFSNHKDDIANGTSKSSLKPAVIPARPKSDQIKSLSRAGRYEPDHSITSGGGDHVISKGSGNISSTSTDRDGLRHFYTSTPTVRPSASSSGGGTDKSVPISTYKFPPLTWKPQPSDLSLVDEYGNYYDPAIERDIGRELFAKSQLETAQALKILPRGPAGPGSQTSSGELRNIGPPKQRVASSLDRRKSNLSREQFFSQVAAPSSTSGGRLISYKQQLKGNYSTPATPVTVQYKKLGSTSSIPTPRGGSGRFSEGVTYHPPSPPRDYDECSSDDGQLPNHYRASLPSSAHYNPLLSRTRISNPRSPVHPASHSITPITIPSDSRYSNRASLTNLMGGGPGARESFKSVHQYNRRPPTPDGASFHRHASTELPRTVDNFTPLNYTKFNHNFNQNDQFASGGYSSKTVRPTHFSAIEAREESGSSGGTLKRENTTAAPIRPSDSRNSMISSLSLSSTSNNNNLRDTYNNGGLTNTTTTDYATACDDTFSATGSLSTPDHCSQDFDMTYMADRGGQVETPDTVVLSCPDPKGKGGAGRRLPNIVFRDYQLREVSVKTSRIINGCEMAQDRRLVNRLASYQLLDNEGATSPTSYNP